MPVVSSLFSYPIKSCRGISSHRLEFGKRGPEADRRWMLVTPEGGFISLRRNALMAQIQPSWQGERLAADAPGMPQLSIPPAGDRRRSVRVWKYEGEAWDLGQECSDWFGDVLGEPCHLVEFPEDQTRTVSQRHTSHRSELAFADGYPALVVSVESLVDLNARLQTPVPMYRFRPNVVLRDCQPFEEDKWESIAGPGITLDLVKACKRCSVTTVDQESLRKSPEPLATLSTFRKTDAGILFGQNAVPHGPGVVSVGDEISAILR